MTTPKVFSYTRLAISQQHSPSYLLLSLTWALSGPSGLMEASCSLCRLCSFFLWSGPAFLSTSQLQALRSKVYTTKASTCEDALYGGRPGLGVQDLAIVYISTDHVPTCLFCLHIMSVHQLGIWCLCRSKEGIRSLEPKSQCVSFLVGTRIETGRAASAFYPRVISLPHRVELCEQHKNSCSV